jgi:hypothetical protein
MAQDDTATELGSLRAGVANSEIGVDSLRATTGEIRRQIERIEVARDATGSIARSHKHQGRKKWVARALRRGHCGVNGSAVGEPALQGWEKLEAAK